MMSKRNTLKSYLLLFVMTCTYMQVMTQCDTIFTPTSQSDIDNFGALYACDSIDNILISNTSYRDSFVDFSPLLGIKYIRDLTLGNFVINLHGLDSLEHISHCCIIGDSLINIESLGKLRKIDSLRCDHFLRLLEDEPEIYFDSITSRLFLIGSDYGLQIQDYFIKRKNRYKVRKGFHLEIGSIGWTDPVRFDPFLPENVQDIEKITFNLKSINNYEGIENIKALDHAVIRYFNINLQDSLFSTLDVRGTLEFNNINTPSKLSVLINVDTLRRLIYMPRLVSKVNHLFLDTILPNLTTIKNNISISRGFYMKTIAINNIDHISDPDTTTGDWVLEIYDNDSLSFCAEPYVCDALRRFPRHVRIERNHTGCNSVEEVMAQCQALSAIEPETFMDEVKIYPNPTSGVLYYPRGEDYQIVSIKDIVGRSMGLELIADGVLNVSHLMPGLYFLTFTKDGKVISKQVVVE